MKLSPHITEAFETHVASACPQEACALVAVVKGRERLFPCRNTSATPERTFRIDPAEYAAVEDQGEIVALLHSHPNGSANPSEADRIGCEASGLPWFIVGWPSRVWKEIRPSGYEAPLIGREFHHGALDCYALIRDYYRVERGIDLLDFERDDKWWHKGQNLYVENFGKAGFVVIADELQVGDVLLMQVGAEVTNHAAIYLGDDTILHHLYGRLSSRDVYGGYYKKHTTHRLRYVGVA